MLWLLSQT